MKIKDAIGIFDNVFTEAECKDLINILEEAKINGETYKGESGQGGDTQIKKSTDFNILLNKKYAFKVCRIEPENNVEMVLKAFC